MDKEAGVIAVIIIAAIIGGVAYFWSARQGSAGISTPTGLTLNTPGAGQVELDWSDNPENDLDHYNVYRGSFPGFECDDSTSLNNVSSSEYLDTGLEENVTSYYYRVTAINNEGKESSPTPSVHVTSVPSENLPPTANFTYSPASPWVENTVTFDASGSSDPDGEIVSYEWSWGGYEGSETTENEIAEHAYQFYGIYEVVLTVTDDDGLSDSAIKEVKVTGSMYEGPVASFTYSPSSPSVGENVTFTNNSAINYASGFWDNIRWDFGDNTTCYTKYAMSVNHSYSSPGDYEVTLTVVQCDYQADNVTKTVTVSSASD